MVVNDPVDAEWFKRVSVDDDRNTHMERYERAMGDGPSMPV